VVRAALVRRSRSQKGLLFRAQTRLPNRSPRHATSKLRLLAHRRHAHITTQSSDPQRGSQQQTLAAFRSASSGPPKARRCARCVRCKRRTRDEPRRSSSPEFKAGSGSSLRGRLPKDAHRTLDALPEHRSVAKANHDRRRDTVIVDDEDWAITLGEPGAPSRHMAAKDKVEAAVRPSRGVRQPVRSSSWRVVRLLFGPAWGGCGWPPAQKEDGPPSNSPHTLPARLSDLSG
jgi:hypothetical protein